MDNLDNLNELKPFEARAIIEQLRKGTVPVDQVAAFTVGRQSWLKFIEDDLQHYISEGGAKVRFINGDYGDGKTHFMSIVRHLALQQNFATSFLVLTRDIPIHKFEVIYQQIVEQLCGNFDGKGIRQLLDYWIKSLTTEQISALNDTLKALPDMHLNFANALVSLVKLTHAEVSEEQDKEQQQQAKEILLQWFEGAKISKRDLKPFNVFESLNKSNSKTLLRSLVSFLRHTGHAGFVLLLDELETIISQPTSVRNAAYENVRLLIDNTEHAQFLHIFFAIIPDVLASEKGFKSYDALWSRVRSIGEGKKLNYRGVLIDLHKTPLDTKELVELGCSIRRIHEISYRWEAGENMSDTFIEEICDTQQRMGLLSEVRLFIKQVIRSLDMAEQGETMDETDIASQMTQSQQEMEQEKLDQLQPSWDS